MKQDRRYALILAGGRGTRFWPRSRKARAKQVLSLTGEGSLIQQTVARLEKVVAPERTWVLTNEALRDEIARQLPQIPRRQILAEPAQRNTAPAIGLAAHILQGRDHDAVMGVFPADHVVTKTAPFIRTIRAAYTAAERGKIALIGIQPRWPDTGYGYLEFTGGTMRPGSMQPAEIVRFREKPDAKSAQRFVRSGRFAWNAGMFFWRADIVLQQLRLHLPETAVLLSSLPAFGARNFSSRLREVFPRCENVSIDYAVLERARGVVGLAAGDVGWSDVGSWNAVYDLLPKDDAGNAAGSEAIILESTGNLVDAPGKLVALCGVKDLVVVDTGDALLVCPRSQSQRVSDVVKMIEKLQREELL